MLNDTLAVLMANILNAEKVGKAECSVRPSSKITKKVLDILNAQNYVGSYQEIDDKRGCILKINLLGKINSCGVIKPRFSVKRDGYEKFEKRFLPAANFGILIVSTPKGIMTHEQAKKHGIGGKLLAYCY